MNRTTRTVAMTTTLLLALLGGAAATTSASAQTRAALVQDTDAPGRNPYQYSVSKTCPSGYTYCTFVFPAVPAGMRLVVTRLNGKVETTSEAPLLILSGGSFPQGPYVQLTPTIFNSNGGFYSYAFNQEVLAYYEAGQTPYIFLSLNISTFVNSNAFSLAGYYIKLP